MANTPVMKVVVNAGLTSLFIYLFPDLSWQFLTIYLISSFFILKVILIQVEFCEKTGPNH